MQAPQAGSEVQRGLVKSAEDHPVFNGSAKHSGSQTKARGSYKDLLYCLTYFLKQQECILYF